MLSGVHATRASYLSSLKSSLKATTKRSWEAKPRLNLTLSRDPRPLFTCQKTARKRGQLKRIEAQAAHRHLSASQSMPGSSKLSHRNLKGRSLISDSRALMSTIRRAAASILRRRKCQTSTRNRETRLDSAFIRLTTSHRASKTRPKTASCLLVKSMELRLRNLRGIIWSRKARTQASWRLGRKSFLTLAPCLS